MLEALAQKIRNIFVGHTGGDADELLIRSRLRTCYGCIYNTQKHHGFGFCRGCGCPISKKARVVAESCPKKLWAQ